MSTQTRRTQRFSMGSVFITPNALEVLSTEEVNEALGRHLTGDWGDVDKDDWEENEFSIQKELRLLSVYHTAAGAKFWIITEADRSSTTVLMPEDY